MAKFHTTGGIAHEIESLIKEAQKEIVLVSPYLQIHKLVMQRLKDASDRGVIIKVVYRIDVKNTKAEADKLKVIENLELYSIENLHAKCFMNEKSMLISSMNLYNYSEKNNREMGIALTLLADRQLYKQAVEEIESILRASTPVKVVAKKQQPVKGATRAVSFIPNKVQFTNTAFCIRCANEIEYDFEKPYCKDCFKSWSYYKNPDFEEKFCHACGKEESTTMNTPLCYVCWTAKKEELKPKKSAW